MSCLCIPHSPLPLVGFDHGEGAKRRPLLRIVRVTDPKTATPLLRALSGVMSSFAPKLGVIKLQSNAISRDPLVVRSYVSVLG